MCQYRTVTTDEAPNTDHDAPATAAATALSRRRLLAWAVGGVGTALVAGAAGVEMVSHGVLPGKQLLDQIDGACSVPATALSFSAVGPSQSGRFYSSARQRRVGYTIAYPPAHGPGDHLSLVVMLHGFGNDHATALFGMTPAQALALQFAGSPLTPMAMVTVDGGDGYWNPHPGDDPMAMVVSELIPLCQRQGLGGAPNRIAMMGISMGGYGALAITQRNPGLVSAVAAISPAIWTSYAQAHAASAGAFASASDFAAGDVVAHAASLRGIPVRIASGVDDPFHPGVKDLADALPAGGTCVFAAGCHTDPFFLEQEPPSLDFLSRHLT
jgi:S-formylglutathione hydrolase FrmB